MWVLKTDQDCRCDHTSPLLFRQVEISLHRKEQLLVLWDIKIIGLPLNSWRLALPSWCFWLERVYLWTLFRQLVVDRFDLTWLAQHHTGSLWTSQNSQYKMVESLISFLHWWFKTTFLFVEKMWELSRFAHILRICETKDSTYFVASHTCGSWLILEFVSHVIN